MFYYAYREEKMNYRDMIHLLVIDFYASKSIACGVSYTHVI